MQFFSSVSSFKMAAQVLPVIEEKFREPNHLFISNIELIQFCCRNHLRRKIPHLIIKDADCNDYELIKTSASIKMLF